MNSRCPQTILFLCATFMCSAALDAADAPAPGPAPELAVLRVMRATGTASERIFLADEPIRLSVELAGSAVIELPAELPVEVRQLHNYLRPPDQKRTQKEQYKSWDTWYGEDITGAVVGTGVATVERTSAGATLQIALTVPTFGALEISAEIAGRRVALCRYLHLLASNGVSPRDTYFCLNGTTTREMAVAKRLGFGLMRGEVDVDQNADGSFDWRKIDGLLNGAKSNGVCLSLIIGHDDHDHQPRVPGYASHIQYSNGKKPETQPSPRRLDVWTRWCGELAVRATGIVNTYEFFNEPWEMGSISGACGGGAQVRRLLAAGAPAIRHADPAARIGAGCSMMNAMDSFLPYPETMALLDALTVHTYNPTGSINGAVAHRLQKALWDTESWGPFTDDFGPYKTAHQIHEGFSLVEPLSSPLHQDACTVSNALLATCQRLLDGMRPAGLAMAGKVPQALLFEGRGAAVAYVHGFPSPNDGCIGGWMTNPVAYRNLFGDPLQGPDHPCGWLSIAASGLIARDVFGNEIPVRSGFLRLPIGRFGTYVTGASVGALRAALLAGTVEGIPACDIAIRDLQERPAAGTHLRVRLTNVLPIAQRVAVTATGDARLTFDPSPVHADLAAGATVEVEMPVTAAVGGSPNAYHVTIQASGAAGTAVVSELINVAVIAHGTPTIDGDLADWAAIDAVPVTISGPQTMSNAIEEYQRLPLADIATADAKAYAAELRTAWDARFFYVAVTVVDATEHPRISNAYGNRAEFWPWPNQHLYLGRPVLTGFNDDGLMLGFNLGDTVNDQHWDFAPDTDPLFRVHGWPDTDHEIEIIPVKPDPERAAYMAANVTGWQGWPKSEVWRLMHPNMAYWHHAFPANLPSPAQAGTDQGLVAGASSVVRRDGARWIYEAAIPWSELGGFVPAAGKRIGFSFVLRNDSATALQYAYGKSVSVANHLSFHPMWQLKWSNETQWGFAP